MKRRRIGILVNEILVLTLLLGCIGTLSACSSEERGTETGDYCLTDANGHEEYFSECPQRVIALSGSLGELWLEAGGSLVGITDDSLEERGLTLSEEVSLVGSVKKPNLETMIDLQPDLVLLSADIESHRQLETTLEKLDIPYGLFREESFQDYLDLLAQFTELTQQPDRYETYGTALQTQIQTVLADKPAVEGKTVLLLRAYSTGFKAKGSDELAGTVLKDFGLCNVCDANPSLLEELSPEAVIQLDPDYLAVTFMGEEASARAYLEEEVLSDPLWASLTAVREGRILYLPKALFHYKPNERWAESYQSLSELLRETTDSE